MNNPARKPPETVENVSDSVREPPEIDPKGLQWNSEGFCWRSALVRVPAGLTPTDLQNHPDKLWRKVQASQNHALRRWDRLTFLSADESWMIPDAVVVDVGKSRVVLGNFKILTLQARTERFVTEDGLYCVEWEGAGFAAFRIQAPGQPLVPMSVGTFDSMEAAKMALFRAAYPKRM